MRPVLSFLFLIAFLCSPASSADAAAAFGPAKHQNVPEIRMSVQMSPDSPCRTEFRIRSAKWMKGLVKLEQTEPSVERKKYSDVKLTVSEEGQARDYSVNADGSLTDAQGMTWKAKGKGQKLLKEYTERLRSSHFGRLVTWTEADGLIPKGTEFTVLDMETGLRFRVQRRAGSSHADVQPLTKQDTKVMKEIYNGTWSWDRRAILAQSKEGWLAASMNGMPHGGDGIPGNDFSGHFCIHFEGSVTHKSDSIDPAHQINVHKAAGQLEAYFNKLSPLGLAELFLFAVNEKDSQILKSLWPSSADEKLLNFWLNPDLKMIRALEMKEQPQPDDLTALVEVKASQWRAGSPSSEPITLHFRFARSSREAPWKIEEISMIAQ